MCPEPLRRCLEDTLPLKILERHCSSIVASSGVGWPGFESFLPGYQPCGLDTSFNLSHQVFHVGQKILPLGNSPWYSFWCIKQM